MGRLQNFVIISTISTGFWGQGINVPHIAEVGVETEEVRFEEESRQHYETESKFISNVHVSVSACKVLLDFLELRVFGD